MTKHIEKELREIFPVLLRQDESKWPYDMFGIECGDGWSNLLLETFIRVKKVLNINEVSLKAFKVHQIKEKFGGLRLYFGINYSEENYDVYDLIEAIIDDAENKSFMICERCGNPANTQKIDGWIYTYCNECINLQIGEKK